MKTFETRNNIKERILREAAREWGYRGVTDVDLNAFDPVVDLMIGACSYELERLSNDITNSRNRIFERLVEILTPDIMTKAQPAHTIVHSMPVEHMYRVTPYDAVFHKHIELKKDIFFSPAETYTLHNCRVDYMAYDNNIVKINERQEKDKVIESSYGSYVSPGTVYLGMKVHPDIRSINDLTFFFDWKNNININSLLKFIPLSQWSIDGIGLDVKVGHNHASNDYNNPDEDVFHSLGIEKHIKNNIREATESHFITIENNDLSVHQHLRMYPDGFKEVFLESDLVRMTDDLLWIKIDLPQALSNYTAGMECQTNCYPVVNRKLFEKQDKVSSTMQILPIEIEYAHFLSVESMTNSVGTSYKEIPLKIIDDGEYGMYALRHRGVKRFDSREASYLINHVLDLVNHEAAAFRGLGYNSLGEDFKDLDIVFNRIKKNFKKSKSEIEDTTFLFISPFPEDNLIYMKYWTTDGSLGNRIPHGTPMKLHASANLVANTIQLMTGSKGGRDHLAAVDSIHAFKEVIMTRGRIVTNEDIKIFCMNALGFRNIETIKVVKGVSISKKRSEGLIRTIDVHVTRKPNSQLTAKNWLTLCKETEANLENKSSGIYPIRIITQSELS